MTAIVIKLPMPHIPMLKAKLCQFVLSANLLISNKTGATKANAIVLSIPATNKMYVA
jgi:hypothetical protein